ncbi:MAG TPA: alpha/beta hydrolase, partial [Rhizomicrobium sp.]
MLSVLARCRAAAFYHVMGRGPQSLCRIIAAFVLVAALCGCASYNNPYYVHSVYRAAMAEDTNADVFYLTDRTKEPATPPGFGFAPGDAPSCGVVHAIVPPARLPNGPAIFAREAGRETLACGTRQSGIAAAIARAAHAKNCNSVLLFVHGFDTGFETAVLRAGELGADTQWRCAVAAFSWSSSGNRARYDEDTIRAVA